MANQTFYIDPDWTGAANGTLSEPYTNISQATIADQNTYLFKRGTTHQGSITLNNVNGLPSRKLIFSAYGTGERPIIVCGSASAAAFLFLNCIDVEITNMQFTAPTSSSTGHGLYNYAQTANRTSRILIEDCDVFNCKGAGIYLAQLNTGNASTPTSGVVVRRCTVDTVGDEGISFIGNARGVLIEDCSVVRAAQTLDTYGINIGCPNVQWNGSSGWTLVGGTTYSRAFTLGGSFPTLTGALDYIRKVSTAGSGFSFDHLAENTSTPTTPGVGEYGFSAGTLYINTGTASSSYGDIKAVPDHTFVTVKDCRVSYTNKVSIEGVGIASDDTASATVIGCVSHHNESYGFQGHRAVGAKFIGCHAHSNADGGLRLSGGLNNVISNCTIKSDSSLRGVGVLFSATGTVIKNCSMSDCLVGLEANAATTADFNSYYGNGTNITGISAGGSDITANPDISSDGRVTAASVLYRAGSHLGYRTDADGKQFNNPPTIGAYEVMAARATRS